MCPVRRTPPAFWGNHNSRDNIGDLSFGFLAAMEAAADEEGDEMVRAAARRAVEAGQRIGDLAQDQGGRIMTVGEHEPYETLVVSGGIRPDGETESEDLGSLSDCQTAYLVRALSSAGLETPLPTIPAPGSIEHLFADALGGLADCPVPESPRACTTFAEAYCGLDWATMGELEVLGKPLLQMLSEAEARSPGAAESIFGSFQDDYLEKTLAMLGLVRYAELREDAAMVEQARASLASMTGLMREFADLLYGQIRPEQQAERRYEAAVIDAQGGVDVESLADFGDFARTEARLAAIEGLLDMPDTEPWALLSDEDLKAKAEAELAGKSDAVKAMYREAYGTEPPIRRAGDGYEARGAPESEHPWRAVERPRHRHAGHLRLLDALPLCRTAPQILDCRWALLGCAAADLDGDGDVDADDGAAFDTEPRDVDADGAITMADAAFVEAAEGCRP